MSAADRQPEFSPINGLVGNHLRDLLSNAVRRFGNFAASVVRGRVDIVVPVRPIVAV